ncbi:predicted protein [Uncinocarpus reesii 1704]|uniref:Cupin 2 conserved barrel domain-containing protein n=1 Tax=Uncinocarpus reesii (strain UAMH 1704) TaxID=336963 RepID=C4JLX8_UNCRE|nr:uncharacterized protein UREG_03836 [Uncinocarpus reesii 1704]EEP78990.1 predicted protein [Uncinocarpus reesii 1704]
MAQDEPQASHYPSFRRIVTGHSPTGEAIVESDKQLVPYDPLSETQSPATAESMLAFTTLWSMNLSAFPINANEQCIMHRTLTVDFGILLDGEVELELDNGVRTKMKQHDLVVQRGTIHAWHNPGPGKARMMFILVAAQPLQFGDKVLKPSELPINPDGSLSET